MITCLIGVLPPTVHKTILVKQIILFHFLDYHKPKAKFQYAFGVTEQGGQYHFNSQTIALMSQTEQIYAFIIFKAF